MIELTDRERELVIRAASRAIRLSFTAMEKVMSEMPGIPVSLVRTAILDDPDFEAHIIEHLDLLTQPVEKKPVKRKKKVVV